MRDLVRMSDIIRIYNNYDYDKAREEVMKLPPIDMVGELEKIKREMKEERDSYDLSCRNTFNVCIKLIDKHIEEFEELKEMKCEDCDYSEIVDWIQDAKTGKATPIYWCDKHRHHLQECKLKGEQNG